MQDPKPSPSNVDRDLIVEAAERATRPWKNKHFSRQPPIAIGKGNAYIVTFTGEDDYPRAKYVYYERGKEPFVYDDLRLLIIAHN